MTTPRIQRLLLAAFPSRFKDRYAPEIEGLLSECGGRRGDTVDLAKAVAREWLSPSFQGSPDERRRSRLQATTATVFGAWTLAAVAAAVFARAVDDHPVPGLRSWGWSAYRVGAVAFELTVAVILIAGFAYWLFVVIPAWRTRDYGTLMPAFRPAAAVGVWLATTGLVAHFGHHFIASSHRHLNARALPTAGGWAVLAGYGTFTLVCVGICATSATRALTRSRLSTRLLTGSTVAAGAATAGLIVLTVAASVSLSRVVIVGGITPRDTTLCVAPVVLLALLSAAAATSAASGFKALVVH